MNEDTLKIVRQRRAEIAEQRVSLDAEDAELLVTERTLVRLAARSAVKPPDAVESPRLSPRSVAPTQKDLILATLGAAKQSWFETAEDLRQEVLKVHGAEIGKNSFQPYLSELKRDRRIMRDGQRVLLADRFNEYCMFADTPPTLQLSEVAP